MAMSSKIEELARSIVGTKDLHSTIWSSSQQEWIADSGVT
jgi:hypothetical protein